MKSFRHTTLTLALFASFGAYAQPVVDAASNAKAHIDAHAAAVNRSAHDSYTSTDRIVEAKGQHVRFDRAYKGLRVIGGDFVVHSDGKGQFQSVSQTLKAPIDVDVRPSLSKAAAGAAGAARLNGTKSGLVLSDLVIYARGEAPVLAYEVRVNGVKADQTPSELHVIVDAHSGAVLEQWDGVHTGKPGGGSGGAGTGTAMTGTGMTLFSGSVAIGIKNNSGVYNMTDGGRGNTYTTDMANGTRGNGSLVTSSTSTFGNGTTANRATVAADAHYGTAMTWDYYLAKHGRNGIANDGKGAFNRVHYGRSYVNAFWSDSCFCMTYGDGDGTSFYPLDSLDVAGHEMTHGVTSRSASLTYSGESGGLNESTSDIFGTLVEWFANNSNDAPDYLIGEELYIKGGAMRYMHNPSLDGRSANCWSSTVGSLDVHYSSGVGNHFFYLLAEGSNPAGGLPQSPTCNGSSVNGIGRDAAGAIWYKALTQYMTSSTNYAGARAATLSAASALYGSGSAQYNAVAAAWSAVNVN
ncbi:MAG: M4 family metallopeptidase [Gammaproteobacteria bacterium]|nr:M4 family metallopeptidase [Gammaproteobacteria bacterium]